MKSKLITLSIFTVLSIAGTTAALAHTDYSETGTQHWLKHVAESSGTPSAQQTARYGYESSTVPVREIKLTDKDNSLNVTHLETVRISIDGKSVVWTFDTFGSTPFTLSKILPGADQITVFVAEDLSHSGS